MAGAPQAKTRPEVYAMGFRNPFRLQVDENDVAYVSDYSPDANTPARSRGPSGVGRFEIVRKPANYGYPLCYSSKLGYYQWNFHEFAPGTTTVGTPLDNPPQPIDCGARAARSTTRAGTSTAARASSPACASCRRSPIRRSGTPTATTTPRTPLGTPCFGYYATTPGRSRRARRPSARGCSRSSTRAASAPHGAAKYHYDPANPSTKKFPPYYDNSVILGEFTQDTLREVKLDSQNRVFKINSFLDCGQANVANPTFPFECDNPMDMQFGADGSFYLLTYGDGFFAINRTPACTAGTTSRASARRRRS